MASTSITFNKLQPRELFTFSICKHFSISFNYNSIISLSNFTPLNTSSTTSTTLFASLTTNHSRTTLTQTIIDVNNITCSVPESSSLDISSLGSVKQRVKKEKLVKGFVNNGKFSERNDFSNREMGNSAKNSSGYDEEVLNFDGSKQKYSRGKNVISGDVSREPIKGNDHSNGFGKKDLNFDDKKQRYSRGKNVISGDVSRKLIKGIDHSNGYGKKDINFDGRKQGYSRGKNVISGDVSREPIKGNDHSNGYDGRKLGNYRGRNVISGDVSSESIDRNDHSNGYGRKALNFDGTCKGNSGSSSNRGKNVISGVNVTNGGVSGKPNKEDQSSEMKVKKREKSSKKNKDESPEFKSRIGLDKCSKMGDVMGAISLYDSALKNNVKMGPYHYTVLLYLCSSAAMGVIQPAKSGSSSRNLDNAACQTSKDSDDDDGDIDNDGLDKKDQTRNLETVEIRVSDDVKKLALKKGFEIYERMRSEKVKMNEAALTSIARMAMAMGDGEMAFEMVNQMKSMGINPKLRSYIPSLLTFCNNGDVEKVFEVEKHMLENGVHPEEPELEALLRVSVQTGKADRVYYLLHKLRTTVRVVSPSTADVIEEWFKRKEAARVGKRKWDPEMISQTMVNVGGGWHGKGWLGKGKWVISKTNVGDDGVCKCCGEKLALIDLDNEETERFAESVASIAVKRERDSDFEKFQKWLDYHGPFEAVVDAANVGLFSYKKFKPSKVNVIVNGIRQMLPSRKWPLIVVHNRRIAKSKMDKPVDRALVDRWINADALYATPTGSNDDWYWLYAAIKFKALLVTNDEMRDHIFQLLGNDFFPKWKERHQVRFSFSEVGPVFHMPPPCSVVIQESKWGHWHIPIASNHQFEKDRIWLCVSRPKSFVNKLKPEDRLNIVKGEEPKGENEHKASKTSPKLQDKARSIVHIKRKSKEPVFEHTKDLKTTPPKSSSSNILHTSIWDTIDAAEKLSGNTIDFQI